MLWGPAADIDQVIKYDDVSPHASNAFLIFSLGGGAGGKRGGGGFKEEEKVFPTFRETTRYESHLREAQRTRPSNRFASELIDWSIWCRCGIFQWCRTGFGLVALVLVLPHYVQGAVQSNFLGFTGFYRVFNGLDWVFLASTWANQRRVVKGHSKAAKKTSSRENGGAVKKTTK